VHLDPVKAYERRWWTLGVLCLSLTVISIDNTILNVALPSIVRELGAKGAQLQWVVDAYTIVFACLLLTAGALGDKFGRRGALRTGLALFGLCSGLAAFATSPTMLILARGLMGIGGALIFPTTLSILTNTFTGDERAKAIGIWAGVSAVGIAIGPLLGGLMLEHFWWGSVFLINVPWCATLLVLGHFFIPDSRDPEDRALDPVGAVLSIVALIGVLYAIIQVPEVGWSNLGVMVTLGIGLSFLVLFALWELHSDHPMLDVRFFRNPRFSAASATITLISFALVGTTFLLTQYFQFALGYSPLKAGLMAAPVAIGLMTFAPIAPRLVFRFGTKTVVVIGTCVVGTAAVLYASNTLMSTIWSGMLIRALFGAGMGLVYPPATESIMGSLPLGKAGVGSAVNDTTRQTGGALGVAVLGSIFAARYHQITGAAHVPGHVASSVRDSIGKALSAAASLPRAQAALVENVARSAFLQAMQLTYHVAAAIVVIGAFIALRFLPARAGPPPEHEPPPVLRPRLEGIPELDAAELL
jgi:EmrB/QacA subfamily drug resistance transporter